MKINDSTKPFFELYAERELSFNDLNEQYYKKYPLFEDYFQNHCQQTKERIEQAILRYNEDMARLKALADGLPNVIEEACATAAQYFGFEIELDFNLFIGAYGSNAYAYRYSIYLAVEKLPEEEDYLKVIVAHEIVHAYHNYFLLEQTDMDWNTAPLMNGMTSMYFEGVATHYSKKLVPDLPEYVYYSYDNSGEDWYIFCSRNRQDLAQAFLGVEEWGFDELREWFRLSGGERFGHTRLGYFLGTSFIEDLAEEMSDQRIFTLLSNDSFLSIGIEWLGKVSAE